MLVEVRKLNIVNDGYNRKVSSHKIYINSDNIISISDYDGVKNFLISESAEKYKSQDFSLIRFKHGEKIEDIIVFGTASEVYSSISKSPTGGILHG